MTGSLTGGIAVAELVRTPSFGLEVLAGEDGLDNRVAWTHCSELADPAPWLEGGELFFTLGIGVPLDPAEQVDYVRRLAGRRAAALAVGTRGPALCDEMLATADDLGLPVLRVPEQTPFLSISRLVGAANLDTAHRRLVTHLQILDAVTKDFDAGRELPGFLAELETITGYRLHVVAPDGRVLIEGTEPLPGGTFEQLRTVTNSRPSIGGGYAVPIVVGTRAAGFLVAIEREDRQPAGLSAVQHVSTVTRMGMSEIYRLRERERNRGERLLEDLLRGGSDAGLVAHELDEAGFETPGRAVLVALGASDDPLAQVDEIDHRLHDADVPHLIARLDAIYLLLEDVAPLDGSAPFGGLAIGVSRPMGDVATGGPLARREALWSLERARANKAGSLVRFDEPGYAHWLPPDLSALEQLVEVYLGPVFAYDREHQADLAATLATFFRHQRKLGPAAKELFVHKNTLTYRLHQIEDLCGRDPTDLEQQTQMWLALKALAVVDSGRVAADERLLV